MDQSRDAAIIRAEHQLVAAARDGSAVAFEALVDRYYVPIHSYLLRQCGDAELARDLTQETFLDAYRDRARIPDDRPFAAWLYRTAHHNARHALRQRRVRRLISLDWLLGERGQGGRALQQPSATGAVDEQDLIQRILNELRPEPRAVLILYSEGFKLYEIASILGISYAAARKHNAEGKRTFQRRYSELRKQVEGHHDDPTM